MKFIKTDIEGAFVVELEKFGDERGFFARAFCEKEFNKAGISFEPVQANIGFSSEKYTLRGMHYQTGQHAESKLVRCTKGAIYDIILDMRPNSPTYKEWFAAELSAENRKMLFLPAGCAHGYQTMEENSEIFYMVSAFYEPDSEQGVRWNDPAFNIRWMQTENIIISEKDKNWPDFKS